MSLVIVLVLVLLLGLMSVLGLRASTVSTTVAGNVRAHSLALEAAEAALRFCEREAFATVPAVAVIDLPLEGAPIASRWSLPETWTGPTKVSTPLPAELLNSEGSNQRYGLLPECMVERLRIPVDSEAGLDQAYLVTARGFSPDAALGPSGQLVAGSETWLQTIIQY